MLKKTIKYTNYDGITKEKDYFFNLKKSELVDLQFKTSKGFIAYIEEVTKSEDVSALWKAFRDIVLLSYGEKSSDGERFMKSEEISKAFEETEAFSVLIMELIENDGAAADFINGIMPDDLAEEVNNNVNSGYSGNGIV